MTCLTALGDQLFPVVEEGSKWDILRNFGNYYLWFSNGASATSCHDCWNISRSCATLLNANGDVVSAMLITRVSKEKNGFPK
jgi:hypothetical protein